MKKNNVTQIFETIAVIALCLVGVAAIQQGCSGLVKKLKEDKEIKKSQELKNDTINAFKMNQMAR